MPNVSQIFCVGNCDDFLKYDAQNGHQCVITEQQIRADVYECSFNMLNNFTFYLKISACFRIQNQLLIIFHICTKFGTIPLSSLSLTLCHDFLICYNKHLGQNLPTGTQVHPIILNIILIPTSCIILPHITIYNLFGQVSTYISCK